jgi:hypothetical protein
MIVTEGVFNQLPEDKRLMIGGVCRNSEVWYFGIPQEDKMGDLGDIFSDLGL